ncbi:MAG: helix-turn-helix transcriptional regulator [Erysipelotrichaceae bacterium]|nr:helix-turn-helix transcriptional regulator [Erysipelotrichaceae bacterium]
MERIVGERVKMLRKESGITQEQLANYLGIDQTTVTKLENGTRKLNVTLMERICELFGCSEYFLLGESDAYTPLCFAFRANSIANDDLQSIAAINKIVMNIGFMNELMGDD